MRQSFRTPAPRSRGLPLRLLTIALAAASLIAATPRAADARAVGQGGTCAPPTAAEAEAIARAYFDAFNTGDVDLLDRLLAPDYRHQGAVVARQDRELHKERLLAVREGFPDGVYTLEWVLVDGDTVAVRHVFRGTQLGSFTGVAPTGRPVAVGAFHVHRLACGQIAETWNAGDALGLFRQLGQIGALPGSPSTPADQELRGPATAARTPCPTTTPAQNAAAARRWYDHVLNQGRFEVLDEILAEDIVHHAAVMVDLVGRDLTGGGLRTLLAGFPDIQYRVDAVYAAGDHVLIRWTGRGTQTGSFLGVPPTGRSIDWSGMNAFRFACGVIVEGWSEANGLEIFRQIGAVP
jgi:steroid delta-isomerase-like uncharacterized protein